MRKLIFITQQVDPGHPALAATVPMIAALAARVDDVVVLADRTVAASAGWPGSTCCVMKTSFRIRRSPCRRA